MEYDGRKARKGQVTVKCAACHKKFKRYRTQLRERNYCSTKCYRASRFDHHPNRIRSESLKDGEHISTTVYFTKRTLAMLEAIEDTFENRNRSFVIEKLIEHRFNVLENKRVSQEIDKAA